MEISILLTLLLIVISLGRSIFQVGKVCLIEEVQIKDSISIKHNLRNSLSYWAEKLVMRKVNLLNTVPASNTQKATQTTLILAQIHKFEG